CVPAGEVADVTRQIVTGGDRRRDGRLGIEAVVTATAGQEEGCLTVAEAEVVGEGTQRLEAWTTKLIGLDAADGAVGQPCACGEVLLGEHGAPPEPAEQFGQLIIWARHRSDRFPPTTNTQRRDRGILQPSAVASSI